MIAYENLLRCFGRWFSDEGLIWLLRNRLGVLALYHGWIWETKGFWRHTKRDGENVLLDRMLCTVYVQQLDSVRPSIKGGSLKHREMCLDAGPARIVDWSFCSPLWTSAILYKNERKKKSGIRRVLGVFNTWSLFDGEQSTPSRQHPAQQQQQQVRAGNGLKMTMKSLFSNRPLSQRIMAPFFCDRLAWI